MRKAARSADRVRTYTDLNVINLSSSIIIIVIIIIIIIINITFKPGPPSHLTIQRMQVAGPGRKAATRKPEALQVAPSLTAESPKTVCKSCCRRIYASAAAALLLLFILAFQNPADWCTSAAGQSSGARGGEAIGEE